MLPKQHGSAKAQPETTELHEVLLTTQNKRAKGEQEGRSGNTASPAGWGEAVWRAEACAPASPGLGISTVPLELEHPRPEMTTALGPTQPIKLF